MSAEYDTECTDEPVCPWCGEEQADAWELFSASSSDCEETACDTCGRDILITQRVSVSYTTRKPKAGKEGGMSVCAYCGEEIKPGQPTVPDEWGDAGERMHIGCAAEDRDGCDIDRERGDS